jgi:putative membrane protein
MRSGYCGSIGPGTRPAKQTSAQLRPLYQSWAGTEIGIEVPLIIEAGELLGRTYSIDRRFSGRSFSPWLAQADQSERRQALLSYLDAVERIRQLPSPLSGFARLVGREAPDQFDTLGDLAHNMLGGPAERSRDRLLSDLPNVAAVWDRLHNDLAARTTSPVLVHGDVCPPNAYLSSGPTGPVVTGIGDFSPHTVNGDAMMDIAGAVSFLELETYPSAADDACGWRPRPSSDTGRRPVTGSMSTAGSTASTSPTRTSSIRRCTAGACGS